MADNDTILTTDPQEGGSSQEESSQQGEGTSRQEETTQKLTYDELSEWKAHELIRKSKLNQYKQNLEYFKQSEEEINDILFRSAITDSQTQETTLEPPSSPTIAPQITDWSSGTESNIMVYPENNQEENNLNEDRVTILEKRSGYHESIMKIFYQKFCSIINSAIEAIQNIISQNVNDQLEDGAQVDEESLDLNLYYLDENENKVIINNFDTIGRNKEAARLYAIYSKEQANQSKIQASELETYLTGYQNYLQTINEAEFTFSIDNQLNLCLLENNPVVDYTTTYTGTTLANVVTTRNNHNQIKELSSNFYDLTDNTLNDNTYNIPSFSFYINLSSPITTSENVIITNLEFTELNARIISSGNELISSDENYNNILDNEINIALENNFSLPDLVNITSISNITHLDHYPGFRFKIEVPNEGKLFNVSTLKVTGYSNTVYIMESGSSKKASGRTTYTINRTVKQGLLTYSGGNTYPSNNFMIQILSGKIKAYATILPITTEETLSTENP